MNITLMYPCVSVHTWARAHAESLGLRVVSSRLRSSGGVEVDAIATTQAVLDRVVMACLRADIEYGFPDRARSPARI